MLALFENPGWGSVIFEARLAFYGVPHCLATTGDVCNDLVARDALQKINPVAQLPAPVLDDDQIISESAAMTFLAANVAAQSGGPWFLGARMTALEIHVMAVTHRSPCADWFKSEALYLSAISARAESLAAFAPVTRRSFG